MIGQPDPVGREVKQEAVMMHRPGSDLQDGYRTATGTYFSGGLRVRGKMYMEASPFHQSPLHYRGEKALCCSMVESFGRDRGFQFEVNGDGMPMDGPDLEPVRAELKPLLVVCFHDPK